MYDRSVAVRLRAEVNDFVREMNRAGDSLDDLVKKSGDSAGAANTTLGRMVQSARLQKAEWTTVGTAVGGVGAAWTGLNVAVGKTGIAYNTLQQTSRAALRTMLGGAEAANAQMDKLDAFARTSPFSKAVFLEAQQQMIGFGIETEKVVPYLSAINEAVAATGGNNNDIAELTRIFSQVQSAAKITATDLMQFGQRGVDAASLIGSQMGMTAREIRESITAGTLDAGQALDALAAGMQQRFGGASDAVKNTMEGAFDRVKAAWRDLSASIMSSAVDPEGGGWFVDLTNSVADSIRAIDRLPDSAKTAAGVVSGLGGTAALAAGGFMVLAPRMLEAWDAAKRLNMVGPQTADTLKGWGRVGGLAAGAMLAIAAVATAMGKMTDEVRGVENLAGAVERLADESARLSTIDMALPMRELFGQNISAGGLGELFEMFQYWDRDTFLNNANKTIQGFLDVLPGFKSQATEVADAFREMDTALTSLDGSDAIASFARLSGELKDHGATAEDLVELYPRYASQVRAAAEAQLDSVLSAEQLASVMEGQTVSIRKSTGEWVSYSHATEGYMGALDALAETTSIAADVQLSRLFPGLEMTREATERAAAGVDAYNAALADGADPTEARVAALEAMGAVALEAGDSLRIMTEAQAEFVDAVAGGSSAFVDILAAYDAVIEKNRELEISADVTATQYLDSLAEQVRAQEEWADNMIALAGRVPEALLAELATLGPEGAELVAMLNTMSAPELERYVSLHGQAGAEAGRQLGANVLDSVDVIRAAGTYLGSQAQEAIRRELADGSPVQSVIDRWGLTAVIDGNTDPLMEKAWGAYARIQSMRPTMTMDVYQNVTRRVMGQSYQAEGSVLDFYGNGGMRENHVAQIAPAGAWRVWAEEETGGESYIPLAPSKRARSLEIWAETGKRLGVPGFTNGAVLMPSYSPAVAAAGYTQQQAATAATTAGQQVVVHVSSREGLQYLTGLLRDADRIRYKREGVRGE